MKKKIIDTAAAPAAIGPYSQAVQVGNTLWLSGALGLDPSTGLLVGETVGTQTEQAFCNIKSILAEVGASLDNVVKTTVFLSDMSLFGEMNEVYARQFTPPFPARSAFAVKELPKKAMVEIEVLAQLGE